TTHIYSAGTWTARLTVTDNLGATGSASVVVTVQPGLPLSVSGAPGSGAAPAGGAPVSVVPAASEAPVSVTPISVAPVSTAPAAPRSRRPRVAARRGSRCSDDSWRRARPRGRGHARARRRPRAPRFVDPSLRLMPCGSAVGAAPALAP